MKPQVPWLAKWLLDRFGVAQNESLMGDLIEERASGRSSLWFWRQTLIAIGGTVFRDFRDHKLLALRAIAVGLVLQIALLPWVARGGYELSKHYLVVFHSLVSQAFVPFALFECLVGWIIARTHRAYPLAMVLASASIWSLVLLAFYMLAGGIPMGWTAHFVSVLLNLAGGFLVRPRPKRRTAQ